MRLFYIIKIKDKPLDAVLTTIETLIKEFEEPVKIIQEIDEIPAQENNVLRATKMMTTQKFSSGLTLS